MNYNNYIVTQNYFLLKKIFQEYLPILRVGTVIIANNVKISLLLVITIIINPSTCLNILLGYINKIK